MTRFVRRSAAAIAFGVAVLVAGSAAASDYPESPAYPLAYDWSGFYLGAHGGLVFGESEHETDGLTIGELDDHAAHAGGLIGFNLQYGYLVYGVEADFSVGEISADTTVDDPPFAGPTDVSFDIYPAATIRGRIGFAVDTWLLYATGGLAFADAELESSPGDSDSNLHLGYVVGGGVEYAVTDWMTLRAEYLYSRFNKEDYRIVTDPGDPLNGVDPDSETFSSKFNVHTVRAGITFNFSRLF